MPEVDVVLRGEHGDITTKTKTDGSFSLAVARGSYRVFVRNVTALSVGMQGRIRLRTLPDPALAGVEDERLMPVLEVDGDLTGVEVPIVISALIHGRVTAPDGTPLAGVVIEAVASAPSGNTPRVLRRTIRRPVLGTDIAISNDSGIFRLYVPSGAYQLVANHPEYAGANLTEVEVEPGDNIEVGMAMRRGCIITGKVVTASGTPPHDGAIETMSLRSQFGASGRVRPDGTFRWTTMESDVVSLRAWPWQQHSSPAQTFDCRDGKTYSNVVLTIPNAEPDIAGTLSDVDGNPVPLAYVDIAPLDFGSQGQQERTGASGRWGVFDMRAGRYQITASAAGRGIAVETISAPRRDVALRLSGTGRIVGTTPELVDGSFELSFHHCGGTSEPIELDDDARLVIVRGGRFVIDRVPACTLTFRVNWRDLVMSDSLVVEPDRTTHVELAIGEPRKKVVRGRVRGDDGKPVANANVTSVLEGKETTSVRADDDGAFQIETYSGAALIAGNGRRSGRKLVGRANVTTEQVLITLDEPY